MRGFRIRTCSQGGWPPGRAPWAAPPSMPVENPAAVNSSVRPPSRKRACYGLSRLRTGEAAEAPHRSVRVVTIVGCGRRVARRRSRVLVLARIPTRSPAAAEPIATSGGPRPRSSPFTTLASSPRRLMLRSCPLPSWVVQPDGSTRPWTSPGPPSCWPSDCGCRPCLAIRQAVSKVLLAADDPVLLPDRHLGGLWLALAAGRPAGVGATPVD